MIRRYRSRYWQLMMSLGLLLYSPLIFSQDLPHIQQRGVLRHLGIPYAHFVTGSSDGLDVELIQLFARHLGVRYEYVQTRWQTGFSDLIGRQVRVNGNQVELLEETPVRGDLLAAGVTILPWRQQIADFSMPTFPTSVWLVARSDSSLQPIVPSRNIDLDIAAVRAKLANRTLLGLKYSCLDPDLYDLGPTGAKVILPARITNLNELAPAILNGEAETTLLDVPDVLIALEKWPGELKVIGPLTSMQYMGVVFSKDKPRLRQAFDDFFMKLNQDGSYAKMVKKYYTSFFRYYGDYFTIR